VTKTEAYNIAVSINSDKCSECTRVRLKLIAFFERGLIFH